MMFVSLNSNTTVFSSGAGTDNSSRAPEVTLDFLFSVSCFIDCLFSFIHCSFLISDYLLISTNITGDIYFRESSCSGLY